MTDLIILIAITWIVLGPIFLIYDWTRDMDLTIENLIVILLFGLLMGPLALIAVLFTSLVRWLGDCDRVIMNARRKRP